MSDKWCSGELSVSSLDQRIEPEVDKLYVNKRKKICDESSDSLEICQICGQNVSDPNTKIFKGLPEATLEEEAALTDDRLLLYCDGELIPDIDSKPLHKITHFTVFDGEGHLCPFDTGLIEKDHLIFFSGYIKPIYNDDPSPENGVPAQELGPIVEWWISGFDGGNSFLLAFRTPYAEYILMEPSEEYQGFMRMPKQKALLTKIVIEFLSERAKPTYEELLNRINEVSVPDDIEPFDEESLQRHAQFIIDQVREVDDKKKLISTPAAQEIIKTFEVRSDSNESKNLRFKNPYKPTVTALVYQNFKFFFNEENAVNTQTVEDFSTFSTQLSKFAWEVDSDFAIVNEELIYIKNFVYVNTKQPHRRVYRIEYFFQQNFTKQAHCVELIKGTETILGDASNPRELFFVDKCSDWPICKILGKAKVTVIKPAKHWNEFQSQVEAVNDGFFIQKKYSEEHGVFEDLPDKLSDELCEVCARKTAKEKASTPIIENTNVSTFDKIIFQNEEYFPGCCVFLEPFSVVFDAQKSSRRIEQTLVTLKANELIYPEIYRKAKEVSLMEECPEPFVVACIKSIFSRSEGLQKKLFLTVNKLYRPENTRVIRRGDKRLLDFQLLFWSEETAEVPFDHVRGRCDVIYAASPPDPSSYIQFYCNSGFDAENEIFYKINEIPFRRKQREKLSVEKLKTLNAFSGCGGLAEGLRQSGVADIIWAVEIDKSTSKAFKLNFPNVSMFNKDCNLFLKEVMSGKKTDENRNRYPVKGDVEFLCGGPPCQGFSLMNRFTSKEESQYNNSLILTHLSFCDYYRPKFFLLENVKNFVSFKKSVFFRHTLACLVAMGYQCSFAVLQAGNFGLPQTRRRLFILAAAPGVPLPNFPKPTHVFYGSQKNFECEVLGKNYSFRASKVLSGLAPFRKVTIREAISDLPRLKKFSLDSKPKEEETFYEKFLMGFFVEVQDHESKEMSPINEARIRHIPASKGCDWRDLPNIRVRLRDGTLTDLLEYSHHDKKNGKSCCGLLRGVCRCASGKPCDPRDKQNNTLIPWFLVHTANRNNNWAGLYGRLDWDGVFNTVTTNPEPSNQQGKVLHPEEDRTVSVRECARAQGIPDSFKLCGSIADKFRQVGNAVPPPVARAIGFEIRKSLLVLKSTQGGKNFETDAKGTHDV